MTTTDYSITPSPELVDEWVDAWLDAKVKHVSDYMFVAIQAAHWAADQELEACCEWLDDPNLNVDIYKLRKARRPQQLWTLKEQALALLDDAHRGDLSDSAIAIIRRALEQLND